MLDYLQRNDNIMNERFTQKDQGQSQESGFKIGEWEVDPSRNQVTNNGINHVLEPKLMAMLEVLAINYGQVVTKSELLEKVWPNRFVVEGVLKRGISELRKVLSDDARQPRFIETVYKTGYRLIVTPQRIILPVNPQNRILTRPYPGLTRFSSDDASVFFGRDADVSRVVDALNTQESRGRSFALVVGPSGCGKSSLVFAGVVPALLSDPQRPSICAIQACDERPSEPLQSLANALDASELNTNSLWPELHDSPDTALETMYKALKEKKQRLVLVVDQLEQLLGDQPSRQAFDEYVAILYALGRSSYVSIIATLRSDFLPRLLEVKALVNLKNPHGQIELSFPGFSQLGRMIRMPAFLADVQFEKNTDGVLLDDELHEAAAAQPNSLPLLQFALSELFKQRQEKLLTWQAYRELGELAGCIANRAEAIFATLPANAKQALPSVLRELVTQRPSVVSIIQAQQSLANLDALDTDSTLLIDQFLEARLFTSCLNTAGQTEVTVAHEALLSHWPRAQQHLQQDQQRINAHGRLLNQARRWQADDFSPAYLLSRGTPLQEAQDLREHKFPLTDAEEKLISASEFRVRWVNRIRGLVVSMSLVLATLAIVAGLSANSQRIRAESEATRASKVSEFMVQLFESADPAVGGQTSLQQTLDHAAEQISADMLSNDPEAAADFLATIGNAHRGLGSYESAKENLLQAVDLYHAADAAKSLQAARANTWLGKVQIKTREFQLAEQALRRAIEFYTDNETDNGDYADTVDSMAMLQYYQGNYTDAARHAEDALQLRRTIYGNYHLLVADTLNNLSAIELERGYPEQAQNGLREAVSIYRKLPDKGTFKLANALNNLGDIAAGENKLNDAHSFYREAVQLRQDIYGDEHPDTAGVKANLGSLLLRLGQQEQADRILGEAYHTAHQQLGSDHIYTHIFSVKYAESGVEVGKHRRAIELLEISIPALSTQYGTDSWVIARARSVLGAALFGSGATHEVEPILQSSYQKLYADLGADSPHTQLAHSRLKRFQNTQRDK